jgi:transcription initiation protein SPT3
MDLFNEEFNELVQPSARKTGCTLGNLHGRLREHPFATSFDELEEEEESMGVFRVKLMVWLKQMMYVSGETAEPSHETTGMVEEIVRQQVIEMVCETGSISLDLGLGEPQGALVQGCKRHSFYCNNHYKKIYANAGQLRTCTENAARRGSKSIATDDLIFLIRHDQAKVSRLRTFLSWKDVRKNVRDSDDKGGEADIGTGDEPVGAVAGPGPVGDATKKNKKAKVGLPWEVPSLYNQGVPEREDEEDEDEEDMNYATLQRLRKADERTKAMTKEEYVTWSEYRQASFTFRKGKRFKEWAGFGVVTDSKPNDDIVDILGFLTFEIVQTLTEEALKIKEQEDLYKEKNGVEEQGNKRKAPSGLFDPPSEGKTPVEPRHIQEAFRRLQARPKKSRAMLNFSRGLHRTPLKLVRQLISCSTSLLIYICSSDQESLMQCWSSLEVFIAIY